MKRKNKQVTTMSHYTLNSHHTRQTPASEVSPRIVFTIKRILKDAQTEKGAEVVDGTTFKIIIGEDFYIGTLYYNGVPVLETVGCKIAGKRQYVWENLKEIVQAHDSDQKISDIPPKAPYIADYIFPYQHLISPDIYGWTGDFARCVAWVVMFPEAISQEDEE